ncbi:MAG: SUMF1/EgtB/PvdO family nonheme iron enzyme [Sedimentisphaerales bacterium]|nr:SUMF1/EgtB/PvdO family nonheme iron enzyme [Sedimentisphaerales bacterium]
MNRSIPLLKTVGIQLLVALAILPGCQRDGQATPTPDVQVTKSGIEMIVIAGGSFDMGSQGVSPDEMPVHKVSVSSFWMDRYEVVQEEFRKYQLPDPSHFKGPKQPLDQINWTDAAVYCNERSKAEGLDPCYDERTWECDFNASGYRLPTEAEWEYACRAGGGTEYNFGNSPALLKDHAWYAQNAGGATHLVGQKKPNAWGLYDMHGNVAEWCNDRYSPSYYQQSPDRDPRGPAEGKERVLRGGAWNSSAESCRSAYRASDPSIDDTCLANDAIGFRCVRNAPALSSMGVSPMSRRQVTWVSRPWIQDHGQDARATTGGGAMESEPRPQTGFVYHDIYLEHKTTPGHPESPRRLTAIVEKLKADGVYAKLKVLTPEPASLDWIQTIHAPTYVERARTSCEQGDEYLDSLDVPISRRSYEAAVMAAGGVLRAVDAVMQGEVRNAFCAIRPPGHHAMRDLAMGFCVFNNVAIGTKYVQQKYRLSKVLIVDWDVHHGNGTQAAFYEDPSVLYFGVHQYPFYPGSGTEAEKGRGKGLNYTINVPLPAGSGDSDFLNAFEQKLRPAALHFSPEFVFVSAGFDAHENDTLGGMRVTTEGYGKLSRTVKEIADQCCKGRLVSVLEGGYGLDGLAASVEAHVRVLMD